MSNIEDVRRAFREFTQERGWGQFHDPKSLILALVGEVGELAELFQWVPAAEAVDLASVNPLRTRAEEELADVFIYLSALADVLGIDLIEAAVRKLEAAQERFPIAKVFGEAPDKSR
ncbi:dCTP diphosphatase [Frankineae bacterium MT45]|nr:dCTP diphosphatase [Frankineae bacterium MT45]